ncbi:hypothetical protein SF1_32780 [Sphingobacterium faecium NBRC 15299]|uniref:response regulator transcription factor n=1 Tax=Sphingobacterium faecium TaxID=34087 RepID=UPI000D44F257|nr:LuxR C-terminal-related transcriptional regulator [Sphingobacterium faecium]PTX13602.1 regulatory LuxR family protein [Sphingobacterium faecium]GEM65296.1 hypothetical protein SF1_32780 [Sphingobacterium faecium NBRC 15299]
MVFNLAFSSHEKIYKMTIELQKLHQVWLDHRAAQNTDFQNIGFDELSNSIVGTGPFYYYIIDFYDMSLSHVSPGIEEIHGLDIDRVTFNDVLATIHPDDIDFVVKAEAFLTRFFSENISREKLTKYKISYCYRGRLKNGDYALLNHQAVMLSLSDDGGYGKSLNIHTQIDHLSHCNTYNISLIGLYGEPSYLNMRLEERSLGYFSKKEKQILKLIAEGFSSIEISQKLFITVQTVKTHRQNILGKTDCKNITQLINECTRQGII